VLLLFYGVLCLLAGVESSVIFYFIGLYDIFFGIYIHTSEALEEFRNTSGETGVTSNTKERKEAFIADGKEYHYPRLVKRYQAMFIDGMLLLATLIIIMIVSQDSEMRTTIMVSSGFILSFTYEPLLTTYSKTVGQRLMKIRVGRHNNPHERIGLLNAYIRWFTKGVLGWLSFVTINFNPEHRAIHDFASDSVMIIEK